jgi:hypothetical protein
MKSFPIASLALVLALSGCSSSPSIEEQEKIIENQAKLIEYEICLERLLKEYDLRKPLLDKEIPLEAFFKECSKFLPFPRVSDSK